MFSPLRKHSVLKLPNKGFIVSIKIPRPEKPRMRIMLVKILGFTKSLKFLCDHSVKETLSHNIRRLLIFIGI